MPYKDTEKQKEAVKRAVAKKRKGITSGITSLGVEGITSEGITRQGITSLVTHPDVLKAAGELETHRFSYLGSYYYWNAGTVREQLRALPPAYDRNLR